MISHAHTEVFTRSFFLPALTYNNLTKFPENNFISRPRGNTRVRFRVSFTNLEREFPENARNSLARHRPTLISVLMAFADYN